MAPATKHLLTAQNGHHASASTTPAAGEGEPGRDHSNSVRSNRTSPAASPLGDGALVAAFWQKCTNRAPTGNTAAKLMSILWVSTWLTLR
jgi:hypothetical protein